MSLQGSMTVERMCEVARVSRASFYRSLQAQRPAEEETEVRSTTQQIALEHRRRYGYRRICAELRRRGMQANQYYNRQRSLSHLLMAYVSSGLVFMLLPGTFLGVWNLLQISGRESAASISPARLQAHGHAQVFGWIGSFIRGIGFYAIPKLRGATKPAIGAAWACWAMWTIGVAVRWAGRRY